MAVGRCNSPTIVHNSMAAGGELLDVVGGHLEPSLDLLRFYRAKMAGFDEERAAFIQKLGDVEAQNGELHRLRWELRAREDEVRQQ